MRWNNIRSFHKGKKRSENLYFSDRLMFCINNKSCINVNRVRCKRPPVTYLRKSPTVRTASLKRVTPARRIVSGDPPLHLGFTDEHSHLLVKMTCAVVTLPDVQSNCVTTCLLCKIHYIVKKRSSYMPTPCVAVNT